MEVVNISNDCNRMHCISTAYFAQKRDVCKLHPRSRIVAKATMQIINILNQPEACVRPIAVSKDYNPETFNRITSCRCTVTLFKVNRLSQKQDSKVPDKVRVERL